MTKKYKFQYVALMIALVLPGLLGACGVKPREVDPPAGVTTDTFPQTYPPASGQTHPPGRYLPQGYSPAQPQNNDDKGQITP